jgi:hypothetical protein
LVEVGRNVTALGSPVVVTLLTVAVVSYLWLQRAYGALWFVVVATAGGGLLSHLLKGLVARERPPPVPCLWVESLWIPKTRRKRQLADGGTCHHAARRS